MGTHIPSQEEMNDLELYKKNAYKRAKCRAICTIVVYAAAILGIISMIVLKECGGS